MANSGYAMSEQIEMQEMMEGTAKEGEEWELEE